MNFNDTHRIMLTHAATTYRGYASNALAAVDLRRSMRKLLDTLSPVKGQWQLIWGPAAYRTSLSAFDDAAMYVARHRERSQIVVAVRGTNPVSLFDWIFGDFLVLRQ